MGERRGTKALELWCRRITDGYPDVNVQNMTTSWRDGLAFCAMIHHFRPDLIDFSSLNKNDVYRNNELAFRIAEQHLGIPALLDAEDMASCTVPDRLSILTYLSQFYQTFGGSSPSHLTTTRRTETADDRIAPVPESPKPSVKVMSRLGMRRDPCAACRLPVFLAEKLMIARVPYHRTCFRCARCDNQLMPGNYYETEEGQYCCETCPDERRESASAHHRCVESTDTEREQNEPLRSLSDEEKTERKAVRSLLENAAVPDLISHTSQMRKNFMADHLLSERIDESTAGDTSATDIGNDSDHRERAKWRIDSAFPDDDENEEREDDSCSSATDYSEVRESNERYNVHSAFSSLDIRSDENQRSAILFRDVDKSRRDDTKESVEHDGEPANSVHSDGTALFSVKKRLLMFEAGNITNRVDRKDRDNVSRMTETKGSPAVQDTTVTQCDSWDPALDAIQANDEECSQEKLEEYSMIKSRESSPNMDAQRKKDNSVNVSIDESKDTSSNDIAWVNNEEHFDNEQPEENLTVRNVERQKEEGFAKSQDEQGKCNKTHEELFEVVAKDSLLTTKGIDSDATENYPEDLNPFKSDEEDSVAENKQQIMTDTSTSNKMSTNPFDSDEEVEEVELPKPAVRNRPENCGTVMEAPIKRLLAAPQINLNPFWSDEDVEEVELPKPAVRSRLENCGTVTGTLTKRLLMAPQINLNPFWSDEEEKRDNHLENQNRSLRESMPVPKPRTTKAIPAVSIVPRKAELNCENVYASNSSITSSESVTIGSETYKKKKLAPQPPAANESFSPYQCTSSMHKSCDGSSPLCQNSSPCTTPRPRKTKPAPPPPMVTSTPRNMSINSVLNVEDPLIIELRDDHSLSMWQDQKINKDEANRNRQSLSDVSYADDGSYKFHTDKSVQGKWKRKKGPAPPLPIPHRRKIKVISMKDVKLELDEIELQQQGLERQGVRLEQLIRDKCESKPRTDDSLLDTDVEELILELFALVNEKNELFRRQAELMLLRRQQRLEEEHAEVEYQIRCLMCQPKTIKTDFDKQREEVLIQRLVDIVERRNEIVECLEMDRRREIEEDKSINQRMGLFAARSRIELSGNGKNSSNVEETRKKGKMKEKQKLKKLKKITKKDDDKDVDESEIKRHNKRKWF